MRGIQKTVSLNFVSIVDIYDLHLHNFEKIENNLKIMIYIMIYDTTIPWKYQISCTKSKVCLFVFFLNKKKKKKKKKKN